MDRQNRSRDSCILSKFYIKPQRITPDYLNYQVVSYRNSTSNHNSEFAIKSATPLYLIEILHQTTTASAPYARPFLLYLIEILHQTTTPSVASLQCLMLYLIEILHQTTTDFLCFQDRAWLYLIEILHQTTTTYSP